MPTKIVYEIDALKSLDTHIKGRKTLLLTSEGFVKRGFVKKLKALSSNIIEVISEVKSHPQFKDLKLIYEKIKDKDFELILAFGGGSVLDAAKFLCVQNEKKEYKFVEDLVKAKIEKKEKIAKIEKKAYKLIPIISIPTTAGTGSELTPWATIWDMEEKKKYSLHLDDLFCELALYDPTLTLSVPKDITIQTALDTLSHSLEALWNKNASEITIAYSIKAAKLIVQNIIPLSKNLHNLEYRNNIMKACMYAALSFSNTQTALAHAMSYYITTHKKVDHGIACSFTLPLLMDKIIGKYDFIDKALKEIFSSLSSQPLRQILKELDISTQFSSYGIDEEEFKKLKQSLSKVQRASNSLVSL